MYSLVVCDIMLSSLHYALVGVCPLTLYLCLLVIALVLLYDSKLFISYAPRYQHALLPYVILLFWYLILVIFDDICMHWCLMLHYAFNILRLLCTTILACVDALCYTIILNCLVNIYRDWWRWFKLNFVPWLSYDYIALYHSYIMI